MNYITTFLGQAYSNVIPFVILLGILVFVHELGHFLVARFCGVRVEVFSLGFGKKLLQHKHGDTTYCISIIPLGGYVKMFGEQPLKTVEDGSSVELSAEEKKVSFTHKNVWQRIAIVLAGPLMNFFFAAFVFTFIVQIGEETRSAVIAGVEKNSPAEKAGLSSGDRILEIGNTQIQSYEDFQKSLTLNKGRQILVHIKNTQNVDKNIQLNVAEVKNPNIFSIEKTIGSVEGVVLFARGSQIGVIANSPAEKLGFKISDEIVSINSTAVSRWTDLEKYFLSLSSNNSTNSVSTFTINRSELGEKDKTQVTITVDFSKLNQIRNISDFGIEYSDLYLDQVVKGSPAEQAELLKHDKIIAINSANVDSWEQVLNTIKSFDGKEALNLTVLRQGAIIQKKITPQVTTQMTALGQEDKRYTIGILPMLLFAQPEMTVVKSASIFASIEKGFSRTIDISIMTVFSFVKLFQGEVSHKNIGGMISIGKAAKDSFEMGLQSFLMTMGILSVSLFILNLLPIPVLDGGHLVFYTIEVIKGSPLSMKKMELAQQIGFFLLMGLMVLALFNDFTKFFFKT